MDGLQPITAAKSIMVEESAADSSCCGRAAAWGEFLCPQCAHTSCYLHAAFRYGTRYCPRCQAPLVCRHAPDFDDGLLFDLDRWDDGFEIAIIEDSLNAGGSARFALELLHQFRSWGMTTCVFAYRGGGIWADKVGAAADGLILGDGRPSSLMRALDYLEERGLTRLAINHTRPSQDLAETRRRGGLRIVQHIHCEDSARALASGEDSVSFPDRLVFASEWTYRRFAESVGAEGAHQVAPVVVIPNCVPQHIIDDRPRKPVTPGEAPIITVLSRIDSTKFDLQFFLSVVEALQATHPHLVVEIAGFGSQFQALRAKADQMGLSNMIRFVGFVDDVAGFLERGLVFFLPSRSENCPYAWLEAAWLMRRAVVPDTGIFTELPANEMLYKFEPQNVASAAMALRTAIDASDSPPLLDWPPRRFVDRSAWAQSLRDIYDL
jgi:glycosyltransferase involved in cell wall biosynthesis